MTPSQFNQEKRTSDDLHMTPSLFKEARMLAQLTQSDVAARIGRTVRTVQRYEAGQSPIPSLVSQWIEDYSLPAILRSQAS